MWETLSPFLIRLTSGIAHQWYPRIVSAGNLDENLASIAQMRFDNFFFFMK